MGRNRKYSQDYPNLVEARLRASAEALRSRGGKALSVRLEADELEALNLIKQQEGLSTARDAIGFALRYWRTMSAIKSNEVSQSWQVTLPVDVKSLGTDGKAPVAVSITISALQRDSH